MRPAEVMSEAARAVAGLSGMRQTWGYPPDDIAVAPSGYVSYPQQGTYDQAYQRGEDGMTDLAIVLIAGPPGLKQTHELLMAWVAGTGSQSLIEHLSGWSWESCDDLSLTTWEIIPETVAGTQYLAAMFKATVVGPGED